MRTSLRGWQSNNMIHLFEALQTLRRTETQTRTQSMVRHAVNLRSSSYDAIGFVPTAPEFLRSADVISASLSGVLAPQLSSIWC
jgi:hypothetical protein